MTDHRFGPVWPGGQRGLAALLDATFQQALVMPIALTPVDPGRLHSAVLQNRTNSFPLAEMPGDKNRAFAFTTHLFKDCLAGPRDVEPFLPCLKPGIMENLE